MHDISMILLNAPVETLTLRAASTMYRPNVLWRPLSFGCADNQVDSILTNFCRMRRAG
jgi:hypothetical protein